MLGLARWTRSMASISKDAGFNPASVRLLLCWTTSASNASALGAEHSGPLPANAKRARQGAHAKEDKGGDNVNVTVTR